MKCFVFSLLFLLSSRGNTPASVGKLEAGFAHPPPECRPQVLWDWMGGMISRDGITKDLEAMAAQGVGGVMIMQMPDQCPYPYSWSFRDYPGKVKCLSDDYFATVNYAIGEADRLGITFGIYACPGWSHFGGPWVRPEQGLKKIAASRTFISGPTNLDIMLPKPPLSPGYFGGDVIPQWSADAQKLLPTRESFYHDEAVLAVPWLEPGTPIPLEHIVNLTGQLDVQGKIKWQAPPGDWVIWRLALVSENGVNHPAPIEAIGLECDRMDTAAMKPVFEGFIGRIAREAKAKGYHSFKQFESDSYEGGYQDFGKDFREQFKRRRGYDCTPWLPAWLEPNLKITSDELTARFRADMVQVISDLWMERFYAPLQKFADANDLEWMLEPYGMATLNWREIAGRCAHPGWEFWVGQGWHPEQVVDTAALYGRRVAWAESFTAEPYQSAWRLDPWTLKLYGDRAFCGGINSLFMHGFCHQPFDDQYQPGLTMGYWGTQLSRHTTWWNYSRPWHDYLSRCQFLLRQGEPVKDVLLYPLPEREAIVRPLGGYRGVTLTDEMLEKIAVRRGKIVLPHGAEFAALVLNPGLPMTPSALEKIHQLVKEGMVVIGDAPPARSASLKNYPRCDAEVAHAIMEIWGDVTNFPTAGRTLGRGHIFLGANLSEALEKLVGPPDFTARDFANPTKAVPVFSIYRRAGQTEFWFVSNQSDDEISLQATFRTAGRKPEWWNPVDGSRRNLPEYIFANGCTQLPLRLAPRQSGFIVFRYPVEVPLTRTLDVANNFPEVMPVQTLTGPWGVSFDPKWGGPEQTSFPELSDWSTRSELGIKYYSGAATYRINFDVGTIAESNGCQFIDLGVVKNLARVRLNAHDLGIVWCAPWRVKIPTGILRPAGNELEIEVVNTWVNRLIGDEQGAEDCELVPGNDTGDRKGGYAIQIRGRGLKDLPDWFVNGQPRPSSERYTFTSWRYYDKDAPLQPSGLLGPVRLMVSTK